MSKLRAQLVMSAALVLLALTIGVTTGRGAIAHDADSFSGPQTGSLAWNHTCTGSNLLLVVEVDWQGSGDDRTVSTITGYKGGTPTAMTAIGTYLSWSTYTRMELFYLIAPDTGTHEIAVTFSGTVNYSMAGGTSLTGVDQTSPLDASNSAMGTSTAPSVSVTTVANNAWIVDTMAAGGSYYSYSPDSPQVLSWDDSAEHETKGAASYKGPITPAGATTDSWTLSGSHSWGIYAASFAPVSTPSIRCGHAGGK